MTAHAFVPTGSPIAQAIGFIEAPLDRCREPFARIVRGRFGVDAASMVERRVAGPIKQALAELDPPAPGPRANRYLLVPTASQWVAFFDNAADGGDPREVVDSLPDELGCRTASVYAVPDEKGSHRILGFTLSAPGRAGPLDAVRVLVVDRQEWRTSVQSYGESLPAESGDPKQLDLGGLDAILRSLGIQAFNDSYYLPPGTEGILLDATC